MKKRLSIWIHGGIGGGSYAQGQPVIGKIIEELTNDYELLIYSQLHPNSGFIPKGYTVYSASKAVKFSWFRWLYLVWQFVVNHIKRPHEINYAFWGYPAGVIAVFMGKLFDVPCIVHLQGGDATCIPALRYGAFYPPISRKLSRWAYTQTEILIALTNYQKQNLDEQGIKRKVEIIPYGPDLTKFKIKESSTRNNYYQFIHIANHNLLKDQATLLKTFSIISGKLPNSKLRIVGYDALNGELKKYCIQLGIDHLVEFTGSVPYDEIPNYLHVADVILHTSVFEGQATVISEAAASGVLLAGTRVGLLSDLGDTYGIIVDVGDAKSLAQKVLHTLKDPKLFLSYINNSRKWVEKHDHQWTVQTIKFHIENLINNH